MNHTPIAIASSKGPGKADAADSHFPQDSGPPRIETGVRILGITERDGAGDEPNTERHVGEMHPDGPEMLLLHHLLMFVLVRLHAQLLQRLELALSIPAQRVAFERGDHLRQCLAQAPAWATALGIRSVSQASP